MAPIDIVQAQAEVASNEERVIVAEASDQAGAGQSARADSRPGARRTSGRSTFEPSDAAPFAATGHRHRRRGPQRAGQAVGSARRRRTASSRATSTSGTAESDPAGRERAGHLRHDGRRRRAAEPGATSPPRRRSADLALDRLADQRGFGSVLGDVFRSALSATGPSACRSGIRSAPARAREPRAREAAVPAGADAAEEPRAADRHAGARASGRNVQTNQKRVQSARASRELQEKKLEAEEKKMAAGMSRQLLRLPGAARPLAGAHRGDPGDRRLQQVAGRLRSGPARAARRLGGGITTAGSGHAAGPGASRDQ